MRIRRLARLYTRASILSLPALVCLILLVHQGNDNDEYDISYSSDIQNGFANKTWTFDIPAYELGTFTSREINMLSLRNMTLQYTTSYKPLSMDSNQTFHPRISDPHNSPDALSMSPTNLTSRMAACAGVAHLTRTPVSGKFQEVHAGRVYVFSAHLDVRSRDPVIRVIGISDFRSAGQPRWCRVWYSNASQADTVRVREDIVPETHGTRFVVNIYSCGVRSGGQPYAVSLVQERCDTASNLVEVKQTRGEKTDTYTVCVAPFHDQYSDTAQLVNMVESNRVFGASRFIFYNYSVSSTISDYLTEYVSKGLAEVIEWSLPQQGNSNNPVDIHYHGQLAAYSDCLYRSLYRTSYVVFLDADEVLVPRAGRTWSAILKGRTVQPTLPVCAYSFRNVFFRTEWPSDILYYNNQTIVDLKLNSLLKTKREKKIYPHTHRSKCIYDVRYLEIPGIHQPWRCLHKSLSYHFPPREGLLHHYRSWQRAETNISVTDRSMHRFTDLIVKAVHNINTRILDRRNQRLAE